MSLCARTSRDEHSRHPGGSLGHVGRAKLLAKLSEARLHLVTMCMLASAHAFVFGAEKGSFIGFPGLQNSQLRGQVDVVRFDNIHGGFECTGRIQFRPVQVTLVAHDLLLLAYSSETNVSSIRYKCNMCIKNNNSAMNSVT